MATDTRARLSVCSFFFLSFSFFLTLSLSLSLSPSLSAVARIAIVKPDKAQQVGDMISQLGTPRGKAKREERRKEKPRKVSPRALTAAAAGLGATDSVSLFPLNFPSFVRSSSWLTFFLVQLAQRGQVSEKIGEERLKGMLTGLEGAQKVTKIKFQRKTYGDDEDEDDYSDL
jgi:DNA-binding TFAR19-related protein (PDSD5 family)